MHDLFNYINYHDYIKDFYEYKKSENPHFSWRVFASKIQIDPGYLVRVAQGKNNLQDLHIGILSKFLKFSTNEREYFELLVQFSSSKSKQKISEIYQQIVLLQQQSYEILEQDKLEYYNKWYYAAIRAYLSIKNYNGNAKKLANEMVPTLTEEQVHEAIRLLLRLKLIEIDDNGSYLVKNHTITTGENWNSQIIRNFQKEYIQLAAASLDQIVPADRDISSMTLAISKSSLIEFREICKEFRHKIALLGEGRLEPDIVYQINIQAFPLSKEVSNG